MDHRTPLATGDERPAGQAASQLRLLVDTGLLLSRERSPDVIVQAALDAGVQLCGAAFGAFFYNNFGEDGERYQLYKLSGASYKDFGRFPHPRPTQVFAETFDGRGIVRSGDITADPRYGHNHPFHGMPPGHLPVRSYLAVPVKGREGEVLGGMFYGHPDRDRFDEEAESLAATVAAQAAIAIDNARLAETLRLEIAHADAARHEQRQTAERLAAVLESTTDAVFLLDRSWRFTFLNSRAVELIADDRKLEGQLVWKAFPGAMKTAFYERFSEVMKGGRCTEFTELYPPLRRWFFVRAYPTAEGIAVFFQDITSAHEAARERDETARRLSSALEAGELGTWDWDLKTDMIDLDERGASIYGVQPHVPVSRAHLRDSLVHPEDLVVTPANLQEALANGGVYRAEYRIERDGNQSWVAVHGLANFNEARTEVTGMIGTVQDITSRKAQEGILRQTEKLAATGRLAATIAHEINNPLEAVTNLIFLAKMDPTIPGQVRGMLDAADDELARVAQIAQQTLGFYRDTTRPVEIDLSSMLKSICELFSRKLQAHKLACATEIEPGLRIVGLAGEIRQVMSNLIVNAIEASWNSEIRIRARRRTAGGVDGVCCVIADHGTGIPPSVRSHMFRPFNTSKQSLGTGLGLWVTKGIVEKHCGRISYRTRNAHPTGTVFRVFLPAKNPNPELLDSPQAHRLQ